MATLLRQAFEGQAEKHKKHKKEQVFRFQVTGLKFQVSGLDHFIFNFPLKLFHSSQFSVHS